MSSPSPSGLVALIFLVATPTDAAFVCPPMPLSVTTIGKNIRSDITASIGSLGKLKAGEVAVKTEIEAKNIFEKYPNIDRLVALQTMSSTYCEMLRNTDSISEAEKVRRWEKFQDKVLNLSPNSVDAGSNDAKTSPIKPKTIPPKIARRDQFDGDWSTDIFGSDLNSKRKLYIRLKTLSNGRVVGSVQLGDTDMAGERIGSEFGIDEGKNEGESFSISYFGSSRRTTGDGQWVPVKETIFGEMTKDGLHLIYQMDGNPPMETIARRDDIRVPQK